MTETVDVVPLSSRMFNKYIKYIDSQVTFKKLTNFIPKSRKGRAPIQYSLHGDDSTCNYDEESKVST